MYYGKEGETWIYNFDLHHFNILEDNDSWTIIATKGIIGEKEYELAPFFLNPDKEIFKKENIISTFNERLDIFSEILTLNRNRIKKWAIVKGILSVLWSVDGPKSSWIKREEWAKEVSKLL